MVGTVHVPLEALGIDLIALAAMTALAALVMFTRKLISRLEATVLLLGYVVFLFMLIGSQGAR
jgi:hypothetical protein